MQKRKTNTKIRREDIKEGTLLMDKKGHIRRVIMIMSNGKYWLSHKNSDVLGSEHTYESICKDKILPPYLHYKFNYRAMRFRKFGNKFKRRKVK